VYDLQAKITVHLHMVNAYWMSEFQWTNIPNYIGPHSVDANTPILVDCDKNEIEVERISTNTP